MRIKFLVLASCLLAGCVSARRYERDITKINENFEMQMALNEQIVEGLKMQGQLNKLISENVSRTAEKVSEMVQDAGSEEVPEAPAPQD